MLTLSVMFAVLSILGLGVAVITDSGRALVFAQVDALVSLAIILVWVWSR